MDAPRVEAASCTNTCRFSDLTVLAKEFSSLLENDLTADVTLLIHADKEEVRLKGHKAILAARSPVFMAMLFGPMRESQLQEVVVASEFAPDTMRQLLTFIYTGCVDNVTLEQLVPLMACSDHFQVESLYKAIFNHLELSVQPENACTILSYAKVYRQEAVVELYTRFVLLHAPKVLESESFLRLDFDVLNTIIQSNETRTQEIDLWKGLVRWHKNQTPEPTPEMVNTLFSGIRYDQMSGQELVTDVRPDVHLVPCDLYVKALEKVAAPDCIVAVSRGRRLPPIGTLRVNDPNLLEVKQGTKVTKVGTTGWNCSVLADMSSHAVLVKVLNLEDIACGIGLAVFEPERVSGVYPNPNQWGADNLLGIYGTGNFFGLGFEQVIQWKVGTELKIVMEEMKAKMYHISFYAVKNVPEKEEVIAEVDVAAKAPRLALALHSIRDSVSIEPL